MTASPTQTSPLGLGLTITNEGLAWPKPPVFEDKRKERDYRKLRLAACFRIFSMFGMDSGIAGHISCRDPVHPDQFWVNPLGVHFSRITVSDLVLVDHEGHIVEGRHPINAAAYAIHSRIHLTRPDVVAAAHAHSRFGTMFASFGVKLRPVTQEAVAFYEDHSVFMGYGGVVAEVSEGQLIAEALGAGKAVICRNHGPFTVGQTLEEAVYWFLRMERACEQTLAIWATGRTPIEIEPPMAELACKQIGSPLAGWNALQPLMDKVLAEQPDLAL